MTAAETDKEARNKLRLARKEVIAKVAARVKEQQQAVKALKQSLQAGGKAGSYFRYTLASPLPGETDEDHEPSGGTAK
jgi:hypothetical protein